MALEWPVANGGRVDCLSATHAIEVDFSGKWHQALGQALYYSTETGKRPGIILLCKAKQGTCLSHGYRLEATIAEWQLPVTVWQCGLDAEFLEDDCRVTAR